MKLDVRKIVSIAFYVAAFVILSIYGTLNFQGIKITSQNLPIYVAAITLGSVPGALVGFIGMFISQLITYGFQATTLFWVIPQTALGALCGYIFENKIVTIEKLNRFSAIIILLQLFVTLLNTIIYAIDGLILGYFNYIVIFGPLVVRIMSSIFTGVVYCILIPVLVKAVKKIH